MTSEPILDRLPAAVAAATSWRGVMRELGLNPANGGGTRTIRRHAAILGLDTSHFRGNRSWSDAVLRQAILGSRTWECGCDVALPIESAAYDLVVDTLDGMKRVQVKTTTRNTNDGWLAQIGRRPYSAGNKSPLVPYDPDVIDLFFIVDGDLAIYVIPSRVIGGRMQILLRTYRSFIVGNAAGLMAAQQARPAHDVPLAATQQKSS